MIRRLVNYGYFIFLLSLIVGQLARIHLFNEAVYTYPYEIASFLLCISLVIRHKLKPFINHKDLTRPWILFFIYLLFSLFVSLFRYSAGENIIAGLYFARFVFYGLFIVYVLYDLCTTNRLKHIKEILALTIGLIIASSFLQFSLYPNIGNIAYLGWDPHINRVVGAFLDPPITVSLYFLIAYIVWHTHNQAGKYKGLCTIALVLLAMMITLTYSRGGFLALGVIVLIISFQTKAFQWLLLVIMMCGIVLVLLSNSLESTNLLRTTSIASRFADYKLAYLIARDHMFTGIGYNHIRAEKTHYETAVTVVPFNPSHSGGSFHSSFVIVAVTGGIIGLILFLSALVKTAVMVPKVWPLIVFLSVISIFDNVLLHPLVLSLLPISAAFSYRARTRL
ncbi:O-antigen ligase family protein [Candidatus Woesebacteria bacterium]|nr:O-antigen ligase family protein [Candidatus Woesebacteria bacterium]